MDETKGRLNYLTSDITTLKWACPVQAMSRYLKDRQILLLGGSPDAELERILKNQVRIFDLMRQTTHSSESAEMARRDVVAIAGELG